MTPKIFAVIFHHDQECILKRAVEIDATRDAVVKLMKQVEIDIDPVKSLTHLYNEVGAKESFQAAMDLDACLENSTHHRDIWLNRDHERETCIEGTHLEDSDFLELGI